MAITLIVIGAILYLIGWAWLLVSGFVESMLWGIGILLFSPIALLFSLFQWPEYKVPTYLYLTGIVLYILGRVIV